VGEGTPKSPKMSVIFCIFFFLLVCYLLIYLFESTFAAILLHLFPFSSATLLLYGLCYHRSARLL
jgi:hypothetical protein